MPDFLVDTDIFIDHLRAAQRLPVAPHVSAYSAITRAELYAGRSVNEEYVDVLLGAFEEIPVNRDIAQAAGRLRRDFGIGLADALIASTALLTERVLVSRNARHYDRVPGLTLHSPS